ncbi:MAG TPA: ABC transporter substrate-binding protein [Thermoanaerobaculia bacterium]|nr:ABC transporter substrate-binding protein [Thermoanaerobaculia bacterium]
MIRTRVLIVSVLIAASCSPETTSPDPPLPKPRRVRVAVLLAASYTPLYIAQQKGYFQSEGLDVELIPLPMANAMTALIQKRIEVFAGPLFVGLFNAMHHLPIRIVADKGHLTSRTDCIDFAMVARRELIRSGRLNELEDIRGLRVDYRPTSTSGYVVDRLLQEAGLTRDDVILTDTPGEGVIGAFGADRLDVRAALEPRLMAILKSAEAEIWLPVEEFLPGLQYSVIVYGPALLHEEPETGRKFMRAYLRGIRDYNRGKTEENIRFMIEFTRMAPDIVRDSCWPLLRDDGSVNVDSVSDFIDWAHQSGHLDVPVPPSMFWDGRFIDGAALPVDSTAREETRP